MTSAQVPRLSGRPRAASPAKAAEQLASEAAAWFMYAWAGKRGTAAPGLQADPFPAGPGLPLPQAQALGSRVFMLRSAPLCSALPRTFSSPCDQPSQRRQKKLRGSMALEDYENQVGHMGIHSDDPEHLQAKRFGHCCFCIAITFPHGNHAYKLVLTKGSCEAYIW